MSKIIKGIDLHHLVTQPMSDQNKSEKKDCTPIADLHNLNKCKTDDVYEHASNITAWQQLYDQLKPGNFTGELDEIWLEGIQFFREYTSLAVRQSCMVWPNALWLGIPLNETIDGYIGSKAITKQAIALSEGGKEFELNTPDNYTIMGIVVDLELLINYVSHIYTEQQDQLLPIMRSSTLQVNLYQKERICQIILHALSAGEQNPELTTNPATRKTLQQDLLDSLTHLLFTSQPIDTKQSRCRENYQRVVTRARDYVLGHPHDIISVANLCEYLNVSRRTLQNCFQKVIGVSPYTYVKAIRLNAVRRELLSSYSGHHTVQDAAVAWGFWHMSQFAADYQALFRELPSKSLACRGRLEARWH